VPLEELFVDGDVFHRNNAPPGVVLGDIVNEKRGIAKGQPIDGGSNGQGNRIVQSSNFKVQS
jgi:hypothetical protein